MRRSGPSHPTKIVLLAVVVVLASVVAAGGLLTPPSAGAGGGERLGVDASERYASIEGVAATKVTVVERGEATSRTVTEVQRRPSTDAHRELVVGDADRLHELVVSNGSTMWLYDRDANVVDQFSLSGDEEPSQGQRLERLFTRLNVSDPSESATAPASPAISPLPVVASTGSTPPGASTPTAAAHGVSYNGTTTVDGRTAYVLRVEPADDADTAGYRQTLWVDAEYFFPLKQRTEWTEDGETVSTTTTYTNVTFDPGLANSTFSFDPPANATVETLDVPETTTYDSVRALRADAAIGVPTPELPPSFGLTYASRTSGQIRGVGLAYANATARVTVATYDRTLPVRDGDQQVTVGDRTAEVSVGPTTSVSWNCDEYRYTVRGEGVPVALLVDVARSVQCE
ncbi:LolA family protein [Halobacterium wangiae]|uniref:LolA family protein n=1 Tax=Halobacterium wangiae TaxID=2902623 RepID=UPI001E45C307|nr:outer membrane lipoprotein carrier protein LolA [Halobacterium wangiae]